MNENSFTQVPRSATDVISNNSDAFDFFTSKKVFGEAPLTSPSQLPYSSPEAKKGKEAKSPVLTILRPY